MEEKKEKDEIVTETEQLQQKIAELEAQNKNLKTTLSERNSEAATRKREAEDWKKKYEATLDEQQLAESKRKEAENSMAQELAELKKESQISKYKAKYLAMGYDEELAQSSAVARFDGNDDVLFQNEALFAKSVGEHTKAEMLKSQPEVQAGTPPKVDEQEAQKSEMMKYAFM